MTPKSTIIDRIETYLRSYVAPADESYYLPVALWIAHTHCFDQFDATPYLCVTSKTKQSGKTTLINLLDYTCRETHAITAMTPAAMFHMIEEMQPTILCDESEFLNSESLSFMRCALNSGYQRGAKIERLGDSGKIREYRTYCPKAFALINDVYDTLRDRSIIISMKRVKPSQAGLKRFMRGPATSEGHDLRAELKEVVAHKKDEIDKAYRDFSGLLFLPPRDEEIWTPLFILCSIFAPKRMDELTRAAVDISTEKTAPALNSRQSASEEQKAEDDHYVSILIRNILEITTEMQVEARSVTAKRKGGQGSRKKQAKTVLYPDAVLAKLKTMPTAPWRKYTRKSDTSGRHLTPVEQGLSRWQMSELLGRVGIKTIPWRVDDKPSPVRVYDVAAIQAKAAEIGISEKGDE